MSGQIASKGMVSIVVINHNYEAFLGAALDSALAQDYRPIEVVLVDDGSTDRSAELVAGYGDRIRAVFQANAGHTIAANTGFAEARGDFVLFLDADDVLAPDCVSRAVDAIQAGDAKVQYRLATINSQGEDLHMPFPYFPPDFSPAHVERQSRLTGWHPWTVSTGNLYARWFLEQLMPIDAARIYRSPDGYLNKLAPLYGAVRSLPHVLGSYRVHGNNAWASTGDGWSVGVALRWLKFNCVLEDAFVDAAARRGVKVEMPLVHPFQKLEYEMLVARFATVEEQAGLRHAGIAIGRMGVLREGLRWQVRARFDGWLGRAVRFVWLILLALAPRETVRELVSGARVQAGRSAYWQKILDLTRR